MRIDVLKLPFDRGVVESTESLFAGVFGYGNYDFHMALTGWGGCGLGTLLALCRDGERLIGAAMALFNTKLPAVAIFGPIAVDEEYREKGIGKRLAVQVIESLKEAGVQAVYLGVKQGHPARGLYSRLGFEDHSGVVMRKLLVSEDHFSHGYFGAGGDVIARQVSWADYPGFSALFSHACNMKAFDLRKGYFSSKYVPVAKFLGVFPEMMKNLEDGWEDVRVLAEGVRGSIVGVAVSKRFAGGVGIDFFIHDSFLAHSNALFQSVINDKTSAGMMVWAECLGSDITRKEILCNSGFSLSCQSEQDIPGYGKEVVETYKYAGGI